MPADPQQLTPWLDGSVKPVRSGEYERQVLTASGDWSVTERVSWKRGQWFVRQTPHLWIQSLYQPRFAGGMDFRWRGLTKEQK